MKQDNIQKKKKKKVNSKRSSQHSKKNYLGHVQSIRVFWRIDINYKNLVLKKVGSKFWSTFSLFNDEESKFLNYTWDHIIILNLLPRQLTVV